MSLHRPRHPARSSGGPERVDATSGPSAGASTTGRSRRGPACSGELRAGSRGAPRHLNPLPPTRRGAFALRAGADPEMNLGQLALRSAPLHGRAHLLQQGCVASLQSEISPTDPGRDFNMSERSGARLLGAVGGGGRVSIPTEPARPRPRPVSGEQFFEEGLHLRPGGALSPLVTTRSRRGAFVSAPTSG